MGVNYLSYEGKTLAVVWAHFRPYLYGQHFTLGSDHRPLLWLIQSNRLIGKLTTWVLLFKEYDFEVIHRAEITLM